MKTGANEFMRRPGAPFTWSLPPDICVILELIRLRVDYLEDSSGFRRHRGLELRLRWMDGYVVFGICCLARICGIFHRLQDTRLSIYGFLPFDHDTPAQVALMLGNKSI